MSGFRRFDIIEPSSSSSSSTSLYFREASIFKPTRTLIFPPFAEELDLDFAFNLLSPNPFDLAPQCFLPSPPPLTTTSTPFDIFDTVTDLIQVEKTPFSCSYKRFQDRNVTDSYLRSLSDRVSALEIGLDRVIDAKIREQDRKYSWTAEIKSAEKDGVDRKYKWIAEIKGGKKNESEAAAGVEKNYKWIAEIKGKGRDSPISRTYTFKASTTPAAKESKDGAKKDKKEEKKSCATRVVSIEEPDNGQGALYLQQVCVLPVCGLNSC